MNGQFFPVTGHNTRGKVRCADCGVTGYPDMPWQRTHQEHQTCKEAGCGKKVASGAASLSAHYRHYHPTIRKEERAK